MKCNACSEDFEPLPDDLRVQVTIYAGDHVVKAYTLPLCEGCQADLLETTEGEGES